MISCDSYDGEIGNKKVSHTQFLRVFKTKDKIPRFLLDSPGYKDKRELEIDITNSLNIKDVL